MKAWKNILTHRTGLVALEVGSTAGRVALVGNVGSGASHASDLPGTDLEAAGSAAFREALSAWVHEAGAGGFRCRITLGASFFHCDSASLPNMSDDELASSARFEAIDRFGLDEAQAVIHHVPMGSSGGRRHVVLIASRSDQVRRVAELAMEAGLLPESIEHSALAAARGTLLWEPAMAGEFVSALHVEPSVATLSTWRSGSLFALRTLEGDWSMPAVSVASHASEATEEIPLEPVATSCTWRWSALAEETLRALRQSCGESNWPSCLAISGAVAAEPELIRAVGGVCGVPTIATDCRQWKCAGLQQAGSAWAALIGGASVEAPVTHNRRAA